MPKKSAAEHAADLQYILNEILDAPDDLSSPSYPIRNAIQQQRIKQIADVVATPAEDYHTWTATCYGKVIPLQDHHVHLLASFKC